MEFFIKLAAITAVCFALISGCGLVMDLSAAKSAPQQAAAAAIALSAAVIPYIIFRIFSEMHMHEVLKKIRDKKIEAEK
ncbi:MAG: hypothetical protein MRY32_02560 [Rickettsiales bacterium]|nr:hypothetical protein [Rickettsiales bacterium]